MSGSGWRETQGEGEGQVDTEGCSGISGRQLVEVPESPGGGQAGSDLRAERRTRSLHVRGCN